MVASTFEPFTSVGSLFTTLSLLALTLAGSARAFNYVADANGTWWGIQDADPPVVDTGSIRATQVGPGQAAGFSTSINGFGGLKVLVPTEHGSYDPQLRFNGEMMRGFGLTFDGVNRFATTQSIDLSGVRISRSVFINSGANWGRWLDSFTNTTKSPLTIEVAFGGQSGMGASGNRSSAIVNTSSGDAVVTAADAWVEVATPLASTGLVGGPQVTVIGTPSTPAKPFKGAMTFAGDWLVDSFDTPLSYVGHEGNFQAYVNMITIEPGTTRSLLHFVVLGPMVDAASSAGVRASVETTASSLAAAPPINDLTLAEICSIDNFDVVALTARGFNYDACAPANLRAGKALEVVQAPIPSAKKPTPSTKYDVVGKTIAELRSDMMSGVTTSEKITQAISL
jgi:amidase